MVNRFHAVKRANKWSIDSMQLSRHAEATSHFQLITSHLKDILSGNLAMEKREECQIFLHRLETYDEILHKHSLK
jgi:hypothetical protein